MNEPHKQVDFRPKVLVLGPGGIKGFLELGALYTLEQYHILDNVETFVGVSVGAIIGLLLVVGYDIVEIIAEAADVNIFEDISAVRFQDMRDNVGLISSAPVKRKLIRSVENKLGYVPTLQGLYALTGKKLVCVTVNLDREQTEFMSCDTEPDMSCVDAVMFSMNIPIIFYKLKYQGCVYVDGALGNPFPVNEYDDGETDILGIYIDSTRRTEGEPMDATTTLYLNKIIHITMSSLRYYIIRGCSRKVKCLRLESNIIDSTGLSIDAELKANMIVSGYKSALNFVNVKLQ
jgi:predicted acylesterase/phospholipase RssA